MTGIDEHIRTINRAIVELGEPGNPLDQDTREAARTALHHIAAREQKQRETEEWLRNDVKNTWVPKVEELNARVRELEERDQGWGEVARMLTTQVKEGQARVRELEEDLREHHCEVWCEQLGVMHHARQALAEQEPTKNSKSELRRRAIQRGEEG